MFLVREVTHMSYQEIARLFGRREHTTALFSCRKVSRAVTGAGELRRKVEKIRRALSKPRSS